MRLPPKVRERLRKLEALRERPGTPAEGEAADRMIAELLARYPNVEVEPEYVPPSPRPERTRDSNGRPAWRYDYRRQQANEEIWEESVNRSRQSWDQERRRAEEYENEKRKRAGVPHFNKDAFPPAF